ncbi:MAG: hypothetical protein BMS9Abin11_0947 [Gammaproteobacteria bacterium]|nr:MAG: hypothetical protein BMS9Abin11_0947 [Gammaproteobacteria bacterium]
MGTVRQPAVAGLFYPAQAALLQQQVLQYLQQATTTGPRPKALVVPHAGYVYSGPVAASAYHLLQPLAETIKRVVLLGPSHRVAFSGLAMSSAGAFHTPLGDIPLDSEAHEVIRDFPGVRVFDRAHAEEHSLEVHLPFLQSVLSRFTLVPLVVGDASTEEVGLAIEALWGGEETLVVVSSDLSHYHDYETARRLDMATTRAIESLQTEPLQGEQACGCRPINGLLYVVRKLGLSIRAIDVRNSGDTAGARDRVVGYGAYVIASS